MPRLMEQTRSRGWRQHPAVRPAMLLACTIAVLLVGFFFYWRGQVSAPSGRLPPQMEGAVDLRGGENNQSVGPGEGPWVRQFDNRGRLINAFRAKEYKPQKGGLVRVTDPESKFYLRDGQVLRLRGRDGVIFVESTAKGDEARMGGSATRGPSRGRLNHVTLDMYESGDAPEPELTLTMNNVSFNNETFRIATESFTDPDGQVIAADQVPVLVRGKRYDFDGKGLVVRWNDRDQRLELLEIAHGERLVIRDPALMDRTTGGKAKPAERGKSAADAMRELQTPPQAGAMSPVQIKLISDEPALPPEAARPATTRAAKRAPQPYRVTFHDNVQVVQGQEIVARGVNLMQIDMTMDSGGKKQGPGSPTTRAAPAGTASNKVEATSRPTTSPVASTTVLATQSVVAAATQPAATQPVQEAIVYWTGKLSIVPLPEQAEPVAPGDKVVTLIGRPVVLTRQASRATCARFVYHADKGLVSFFSTPELPQVVLERFRESTMAEVAQATLVTQQLDYSPEQQLATFTGVTRANLRGGAHAGEPSQNVDAEWKRLAKFYLAGSGDAASLQRMTLEGNVTVRSPQLSLDTDTLEADFEPARSLDKVSNDSTAPKDVVVKHVTAIKDVYCLLTDSGGEQRKLWTQRLDLDTATSPSGDLYPRKINATGQVKAVEKAQQLTSGMLEMLLSPAALATTRPTTRASAERVALDLESMHATENVVVASPDGKGICDELKMTQKGGKSHVELLAAPAAQVIDKKGNILRGPRIIVDPKTGQAHISGPGSLHAIGESANGQPGRPLDVTWQTSAIVDNTTDRIDVTGKVRSSTPDPDGTLNTTESEEVHILLARKPGGPTTRAQRADDQAISAIPTDVFKDKQVSVVTLEKDAVINSKLAAIDGSILREFQMDAQTIRYEMLRDRLVVPVAGKMLVRDHRPPDAKTGEQDGALGAGRGATAFAWGRNLVYDQLQRRAVMSGQVQVAHQDDGQNQPGVRLFTELLTADFQPVPAGVATTQPGGRDPSKLELKFLTAQGGARVVRDQAELNAEQITYDPATHLMRAIGSGRAPATFTQTGGLQATEATEIQWNTQSWNVRFVNIGARVRK